MTTQALTRRPSAPTLASLEQRIAHQQSRINRGVQAGTLTSTEASALRERLAKAQTNIQNDAFDGNGLTRGKEAAKVLRGIGKDIRKGAHNEVRDLGKGLTDVDTRIARGLKDGSLTTTEADALKAKAAQLRTELSGATTPDAQRAFATRLDALSKEVHSERHDAELDSGKRVASFNQRIAAGLKDGSLTRAEAAALCERVAAVSTRAAPDAAKVNALDRDIFKERHDVQLDGKVTTQALQGRIDRLERSGKLTPDQASAFRAELEALKRDDAKAVNPRLNVLREQLHAFSV